MPRVLLIDDDIELCEMLSEYLAIEGFEVAAAPRVRVKAAGTYWSWT
jgi:DNA-binding response OmpR family regulator